MLLNIKQRRSLNKPLLPVSDTEGTLSSAQSSSQLWIIRVAM